MSVYSLCAVIEITKPNLRAVCDARNTHKRTRSKPMVPRAVYPHLRVIIPSFPSCGFSSPADFSTTVGFVRSNKHARFAYEGLYLSAWVTQTREIKGCELYAK
jgi:hypothetical protein